MAGLYQNFAEERRFVILTTAADSSMIEVHNRMPVVLQYAERDAWLSSEANAAKVLRAKRPELIRQT